MTISTVYDLPVGIIPETEDFKGIPILEKRKNKTRNKTGMKENKIREKNDGITNSVRF